MSNYHINNVGYSAAAPLHQPSHRNHFFKPSQAAQPNYDHYDHLCKLLVIGDSGCGKSSLLKRFADDEFHLTYSSTIGVDFEVRTVDVGAKKVKMQMWDTAGQERFRTITSSYYRGAHAVIIVCDVTSESSFSHISRWLGELEAVHKDGVGHSDSPQVLLVANKVDLVSQRVVERHRIEELARELSIPFLETSAKNNTNVAQAFQDVATAFVQQRERQLKDGKVIGGPGGKAVHGLPVGEDDDQASSGWKKCFGACSIQ